MTPNTAPKKPVVGFSPEQMELVLQLIAQGKNSTNERTSQAISRFTDMRDPKELQTCPIYRFDGKFVIGFKDYNQDPYRKTPKYWDSKLDMNRKLADQPFCTLLLSNDGKDIEEKEVPLISYLDRRMKVKVEKKDFKVELREIIEEHGILGRPGGGTFASDFNDNGRAITPLQIKAETKRVERTFIITLPGFDEPVVMPEAFLA